jgi:phosphohistidine phosphatase
MKIYLVRHGIASERIGGSVLTDSMRPLTEDGRKESRSVAMGLRKINVKPDFFVSSPLLRAKQTAEIFADVLGDSKSLRISDALAPGGSAQKLYSFMQEIGLFQEIMLFGHEPDIGILSAKFMGAPDEMRIPFKKSGVCRVDIGDLPPSSAGVLRWFITPKIAINLC